jgi:hypothetical protein
MNATSTMESLLRGFASDDFRTMNAAVAQVRDNATALATAERLLRDDPAVRGRYRGSAASLAAYLRAQAGLMSTTARAARGAAIAT